MDDITVSIIAKLKDQIRAQEIQISKLEAERKADQEKTHQLKERNTFLEASLATFGNNKELFQRLADAERIEALEKENKELQQKLEDTEILLTRFPYPD